MLTEIANPQSSSVMKKRKRRRRRNNLHSYLQCSKSISRFKTHYKRVSRFECVSGLITYFLSNRKQRVSVNGALSDITDVTSGVPQGSVLGPILFLLYINDINENVQSSIRFFAHDSIIDRKINSNIDHQILQTDLAELEKWSDKWQMQFNLSKCVHLPITNKTKPSSHQYSLFGHPLSKVAMQSLVPRSKIRFQIILGKTYHRNYLKIVKSLRNGQTNSRPMQT